ncbi:MAG: PilZ domain-containing protein [Deltaproteobacteria bacterium]|nr:PilZ domain-containing protein [Deltaproteobacteria bacterium]MBW2171377.1 PilZ domain-containing protein [Deltaproteobacteria bacterium]
MTEVNQRKHHRFRSLNLLSYVCIDESQNVVRQGMGRTLDVSEGGILLETHAPIPLQHTISLTIGLEDDVTEIDGRAVYSRPGGPGKYESGIAFYGKNEAGLRILRKYIEAFVESKTETDETIE